MKRVDVRDMQPADLPSVHEIDRQAFSMPWPDGAYKHEIEDEHSFPVVAVADGQVVGMGVLWLVLDEAHIATIAVLPEWRGQGVGKLILGRLLEIAREQGARLATLEVRVSNYAAQALYRSFGFELVGWRPRYYSDNREDALIMTLPIAQQRS